ncbi:MAG TPA: hypothetical protein VK807_08005 [Gemmatimonadaceae bacterium]|nr:hypothetical protein [Gemmatimonadaceae bacterium]
MRMRAVLFGLTTLVVACSGDREAVPPTKAPAVAPTQPSAAVAVVKRVRHKVAVAAEEAAGMIEDKLDVTRREVKQNFATELSALLSSADNRSDYWSVVMDSEPSVSDRSAFYDARLRLTSSGDCRFSPGDSVATYVCNVHDPAPFSDLSGKLAAYADASRNVIPASWIQAGEDGSFHAVNPFCSAEQIRFAFAPGDTLRLSVTLPYDQPCAPPYKANTSKS